MDESFLTLRLVDVEPYLTLNDLSSTAELIYGHNSVNDKEQGVPKTLDPWSQRPRSRTKSSHSLKEELSRSMLRVPDPDILSDVSPLESKNWETKVFEPHHSPNFTDLDMLYVGSSSSVATSSSPMVAMRTSSSGTRSRFNFRERVATKLHLHHLRSTAGHTPAAVQLPDTGHSCLHCDDCSYITGSEKSAIASANNSPNSDVYITRVLMNNPS